MNQSELLRECVEEFKRLAGARHASVAIHLSPLERRSLFVAEAGAGPAVAELQDEATAWAFISARDVDDGDAPVVSVVPGKEAGTTLVRVAFHELLPQPSSERRDGRERRLDPVVRTALPRDGALWIGLRDASDVSALVGDLNPETAFTDSDPVLHRLTNLCCRLAFSVYYLSTLTLDPVSQLAGRTHLQDFLRRAVSALKQSEQPIALLLVTADDFAMINCRHGRQFGDQAIREIAERLESTLRSTDGLFRYNGAAFAVVLPATNPSQARATADKLRTRLVGQGYLEEQLPLTFSMGVAVATPEELQHCEDAETALFRHADTALNSARLSGGAQCCVLSLSDEDAPAHGNPLNGVFTADTEKDHRNMLLLWDTVTLVSSVPEPAQMASRFVERIASVFRPERVALLRPAEEGLQTVASSLRDDARPDGRITGRPIKLKSSHADLVTQAIDTRQVARSRTEQGAAASRVAYAVPLVSGAASQGCLFLEVRRDTIKVDSADVVFLNALASQMAVAMERAELASRQFEEKDRESRSLRREVRGLRQALKHSRMVYQSQAMHEVMQLLTKVAPTDATVLIIGESGTGKEVLARSVHELSDRREAPFVVFDCGAVAPTLLEAELFGHIKGAFTGADKASEGHIARAAGGTLFLDEIGELPLGIQAKLLRFVQEKEFAPVGSASTRQVDVRVVAATNRRLEDEVAGGRFRADLYYRLRVIAVDAPPLRQRPEDILPLAHYFVEKYAVQHGRPVSDLTPAAQQKLQQYAWPGNVRELENSILRAVLTHGDGPLDAAAIELEMEGRAPVGAPVAAVSPLALPPTAMHGGHVAADAAVMPPPVDPWGSLQAELERQVELAVADDGRRPVPLGRWLNEDLILQASEACDNVARRAASLIQVPESTFRRHLDKVHTGVANGGLFRTDHWSPVRPLLRRLIEQADAESDSGHSLLERSRSTLLRCVRSRLDGRASTAASLMGVTPLTYKRWLSEQEERS